MRQFNAGSTTILYLDVQGVLSAAMFHWNPDCSDGQKVLECR